MIIYDGQTFLAITGRKHPIYHAGRIKIFITGVHQHVWTHTRIKLTIGLLHCFDVHPYIVCHEQGIAE